VEEHSSHWLTNFNFFHCALLLKQKVHVGFWRAFISVWPMLETILQAYRCPVYFTRHSLGDAIAALTLLQNETATVYAFGAPRIGNDVVARYLDQSNCYRFINNKDIVPKVPPMHFIPAYRHGVQAIILDNYNTDTESAPKRFTLPQSLTDHSAINYSNGIANMIISK